MTAMQVTIKHIERVKFSIHARSHTILCDLPIENDGDDTGMTPPELMLASLGSCAAFYAVQYLKARNLADTGVKVSVTADKLMQPPRLGNFKVNVVCPVSLTEDQSAGIRRAVHRCLIHNTLLSSPEILIELTTSEAAIQHA
jgi:putative redox protein